MKRGEPQLYRDYYGELYIIVDDDGEPVSDYYTELTDTRIIRDSYETAEGDRPWAQYRIAQVSFKVVIPDDGTPIQIIDDPQRRAS